MRDLDRLHAADGVASGRDQPLVRQRLQQRLHGFEAAAGRRQVVQRHPAPRVGRAFARLHQPQQHIAHRRALLRRVAALPDGIGFGGQRALNTAEAIERRPGAGAVRIALFPQLREGVLQQRQRAIAIGGLPDQLVDQSWLEPAAGQRRWLFDHRAQLIRLHGADRHQVPLDLRGQCGILQQAMEEVGPHRQYHQHGPAGGVRGRQHALDEGPLLLGDPERALLRIGGRQGPQLLGLIDHQHQARARAIVQQQIGDPQQRLAVPRQLAPERQLPSQGASRVRRCLLRGRGGAGERGERGHQPVERARAGLQRGVVPCGAVGRRAVDADLQRVEQPRLHQAALAAAGRAQHRQEAGVGNLRDR